MLIVSILQLSCCVNPTNIAAEIMS